MSSDVKDTAIILARVSSEEQARKGTSIEDQVAKARLVAQSLTIPVHAVYEEPGDSGEGFLARPKLQAALADLKAGRANVLIVKDIMRLSREREFQSLILRRIKEYNARVVFCDVDYPDNAMGEFMLHISGDWAHAERRITRERTMAGKRNKALKGTQPARSMRPYGYNVVTERLVMEGRYPLSELGSYQIVEEEARWVKEIYTRLARGESATSVCKWLVSQGVPTPRGGRYWYVSTVVYMVQNEVYYGSGVYGRHQRRKSDERVALGFKSHYKVKAPIEDRIIIPAPPLVDEMTWHIVQRRIAENRNTLGGNPRYKSMLSGLIYCPKCGRKMAASMLNQKSLRTAENPKGKMLYFYCRDARPSKNPGGIVCSNAQYRGCLAERMVIERIEEICQRPDILRAEFEATHKEKTKNFDADEHKRLAKEIAALDKREDALVEGQIRALQAGGSTVVWDRKLGELATRRNSLQEKLQEIEATREAATATTLPARVRKITTALQDMLVALKAPDLTGAEKHDLLAHVVERITPKGRSAKAGFNIEFKPVSDEKVNY